MSSVRFELLFNISESVVREGLCPFKKQYYPPARIIWGLGGVAIGNYSSYESEDRVGNQ